MALKQLTPEEKEDLDKRTKGFNKELITLLAKYKLGIAAIPIITRDGRLVASPQIFDDIKRESEPPGPKVEGEKIEPNTGLSSSEN